MSLQNLAKYSKKAASKLQGTQPSPNESELLVFDGEHRTLAMADSNGAFRLYGKYSGHLQHPGRLPCKFMRFLDAHWLFVSIDDQNRLHVWNLRNYSISFVASLSHVVSGPDASFSSSLPSSPSTSSPSSPASSLASPLLTCFEVLSKSTWLFLGTNHGSVYVYDIIKKNLSAYMIGGQGIGWGNEVVALAENPRDPNLLLIGHLSGLLVLWNLKHRTPERTVHYQKDKHVQLAAVSWHPTGRYLATGYENGEFILWDFDHPTHNLHYSGYIRGNIEGSSIDRSAILKLKWLVSEVDSILVAMNEHFEGLSFVHIKGTTVFEGPPNKSRAIKFNHPITDFEATAKHPRFPDHGETTHFTSVISLERDGRVTIHESFDHDLDPGSHPISLLKVETLHTVNGHASDLISLAYKNGIIKIFESTGIVSRLVAVLNTRLLPIVDVQEEEPGKVARLETSKHNLKESYVISMANSSEWNRVVVVKELGELLVFNVKLKVLPEDEPQLLNPVMVLKMGAKPDVVFQYHVPEGDFFLFKTLGDYFFSPEKKEQESSQALNLSKVTCFESDPSLNTIALGDSAGVIRVLKLDKNQVHFSTSFPNAKISAIALTPNAVIAGCLDGTVYISSMDKNEGLSFPFGKEKTTSQSLKLCTSKSVFLSVVRQDGNNIRLPIPGAHNGAVNESLLILGYSSQVRVHGLRQLDKVAKAEFKDDEATSYFLVDSKHVLGSGEGDRSLLLVVQCESGEIKILTLPGLEEVRTNTQLLGNRKELKCSITLDGRVSLFSKKTELQRTTLTNKTPLINWKMCVDPDSATLRERFPPVKTSWFDDMVSMFQTDPREELQELFQSLDQQYVVGATK